MTLLFPFNNKNRSHYRYFYNDIFVSPSKRHFFLVPHRCIRAFTPISSDGLLIFLKRRFI